MICRLSQPHSSAPQLVSVLQIVLFRVLAPFRTCELFSRAFRLQDQPETGRDQQQVDNLRELGIAEPAITLASQRQCTKRYLTTFPAMMIGRFGA
jgi:hypothetical protein